MKRVGLVIGYFVMALTGAFAGYHLNHQSVAPTATQNPGPKPVVQLPTRLQSNQYHDEHLGFQMTVPDDWINRYAAVENGQSVSFAFQTASSPVGTTKLTLAEVFTIYRYPLNSFDSAKCGCTELSRNSTYVFGYIMDGVKSPSLVPLLTPAVIQQELDSTVSGSFQIDSSTEQ